MASMNQSDQLPSLRRPDTRMTDPGKVRLGDGFITAEFPPLRRPEVKYRKPGEVKLGELHNGGVSA